jgi:hypothetical protein
VALPTPGKSPSEADLPPWEYHGGGENEGEPLEEDHPPWWAPADGHDDTEVADAFWDIPGLEILQAAILAIVAVAVLGFTLVLYRGVRAMAARFPRAVDIDEPLIGRQQA